MGILRAATFRNALALGVLALTVGKTLASDLDMRDRYVERLAGSSRIESLQSDSFGDHLSLKNGAVEFVQIDIDIPGNNALPMRLGRRLRIEDTVHQGGFLRGFGPLGGDIEVPYLTATFATATGWQVSGATPNLRCSHPGKPVNFPSGTQYVADEYWNGYWLHVPGIGEQAMLANPDPSIPAKTGTSTPWITKDFWRVSCTTSTQNSYPGEGFVLISPDGTKYFLDWVVSKPTIALSKYLASSVTGSAFFDRLPRVNVYFLASRVEDRFGNSVTYAYSGDNLASITSSDGRQITVTGRTSDGQIASVSSSVGSWTYSYTSSTFTVTRPDGSKWQYASTGATSVTPALYTPSGYRTDCPAGEVGDGQFTYAVTSPSGATATFDFGAERHFRHNIPRTCSYSPPTSPTSNYYYRPFSNFSDTLTLLSKQITGLGLVPMKWSYTYEIGGSPVAFVDVCSQGDGTGALCNKAIATEVQGPNRFERYTFGAWYGVNEGQLLKVETGSDADHLSRVRISTFMDDEAAASQVFPDSVGDDLTTYSDDLNNQKLRPLVATSIQQDSATFDASYSSFDGFARPKVALRGSSLGNPDRSETTTYSDNMAKWVLGQVKSVVGSGSTISQTDYNTTWAVPIQTYSFGKPQQGFTYNFSTGNTQAGTLASVTDGNGNTTTFSDWKRGIPQTITYPATENQPTAVSQSAVVDNGGWITSITDENGYKTCYGHDAMGRVNKITYPSEAQVGICDTSTWAPTTITFDDGYPAAYGVPAGHWRQTTLTGNGRKVLILDALWRPIVEQTLDLGDVADTTSEVIKRYDAEGRLNFQSYPMNTVGKAVYTDPDLKGLRTTYDALDRVTRVDQDTEIPGAPIVASYTAYLPGFVTRVTDNRGYKTTASYMAYDAPSTDWPVAIAAADGTAVESDTDISRDPFGKPTVVTRHDPSGTVAETRRYVYNPQQELCKTIEPETGSSLQHFDEAGNLDWTATGLNLPSATSCDATNAAVAARKVMRTYDARNRLMTLAFPDGVGDQAWTYTSDNLPKTITAYNGANHDTPVVTTYSYFKRRFLYSEVMSQPGASAWSIRYGYDANGNLDSQTYPSGKVVDYVPNAIGQATRAGIEGATNPDAWGATYYANGAVAHFSYGNSIRHDLTQNVRGLPERSRDERDDGLTVHDDSYDYDGNGNVKAISDGRSDAELNGRPRGDRTMGYDALNRLNTVVSPMYDVAGNTFRSYFDALDNIGHVVAPGRNLYYCYDANWRLTNLKTDSCSGASVSGLGYDAQGNVSNHDGKVFDFDFGNRLRSVSYAGNVVESYRYDGLGRRVLASSPTLGNILSQYTRDGQLFYQSNQRTGKVIEYVYFAGSLVNERVLTLATGAYANRYQFTDGLGSPVAVTNGSGSVLETSEYEPFGKLLNRPMSDGPGYTGHVDDAATGLSYMQQRYYDPGIGRFLSVDPVTANGNTGGNFNRYKYANNNPYRFTDPDGRQSVGEMIDDNAMAAASRGDSAATYGWALAGTAWKFLGAEGISQVADKGLSGSSTGDKVSAGLEVAAALPPVKLAGEAATLVKDAVKVEKAAAQGPRYATGKLREQVLNKGRQADGSVKCSYCGKPTATTSDHVVPHSKGGTTTIDNLEPACVSCNSSKGAKDLGSQWVPPKERNDL